MLAREQLKKRIYPHYKNVPEQVRWAACADVFVWKHKNVWVFRSDSDRVRIETLDPSTVTIEQLFKQNFP